MIKKLINLFKKKGKVHVAKVYNDVSSLPIHEQILWIMDGCIGHTFKDTKEFNIFVYKFANDLIYNIIKDGNCDKDTLHVDYQPSYYINIWSHENGCNIFDFYSTRPIENNIENLKTFINHINTHYKCLNLQESTNQNK